MHDNRKLILSSQVVYYYIIWKKLFKKKNYYQGGIDKNKRSNYSLYCCPMLFLKKNNDNPLKISQDMLNQIKKGQP